MTVFETVAFNHSATCPCLCPLSLRIRVRAQTMLPDFARFVSPSRQNFPISTFDAGAVAAARLRITAN